MTQNQISAIENVRDVFNVDKDAWWLRVHEESKSAWVVKVKIAGVHLSDITARWGRKSKDYLVVYIYNTNSLQHIAMNKVDGQIFLNYADAREFAEKSGYEF